MVLTRWSQVAASDANSCYIATNGDLYCFGDNTFGQSLVPDIDADDRWVHVSAGSYHVCGITERGHLHCWGYEGHDLRKFPTDFDAYRWMHVTCGEFHICALSVSGKILCWGSNDEQQTSVPSIGPARWISVHAGKVATCGLTSEGEAVCWGRELSTRPPVPAIPEPWQVVKPCGVGRCGLTVSGLLQCWGLPEYYEQYPPPGPYRQFECTSSTFCGLYKNGTLWCYSPLEQILQSPPAVQYDAFSLGTFHGIGVTRTRVLVAWGADNHGNLGQLAPPAQASAYVSLVRSSEGLSVCGTTTRGKALCWGAALPSIAGISKRSSIAAVAIAQAAGCALQENGTVVCWDLPTGDIYTPPPEGINFTQLSGGSHHFCGIDTGGGMHCWGRTLEGQTQNPSGPELRWSMVACGPLTSCGILQNNATLVCWGVTVHNTVGMPRQEKFSFISISPYHMCGIALNGTLMCWGTGSQYQAIPAIPIGSRWKFVDSGVSLACGIAEDAVYFWDGEASVSTPVRRVPAGAFPISCAAIQNQQKCVLLSTGRIHCSASRQTNAPIPNGMDVPQVYPMKRDNLVVAYPQEDTQDIGPARLAAVHYSAVCFFLNRDTAVRCMGPDAALEIVGLPSGRTFVAATMTTTCLVATTDHGTLQRWLLIFCRNAPVRFEFPGEAVHHIVSAGNSACYLQNNGSSILCHDLLAAGAGPSTFTPPANLQSLTSVASTLCGLTAVGRVWCNESTNFYEQLNEAAPFTRIHGTSSTLVSGFLCGLRSFAGVVCIQVEHGKAPVLLPDPGVASSSLITMSFPSANLLLDDKGFLHCTAADCYRSWFDSLGVSYWGGWERVMAYGTSWCAELRGEVYCQGIQGDIRAVSLGAFRGDAVAVPAPSMTEEQCKENTTAVCHDVLAVRSGMGFACWLLKTGIICMGPQVTLGYGAACVPKLSDDHWIAVTASYYHACGLTSKQNIHCWGSQLGG